MSAHAHKEERGDDDIRELRDAVQELTSAVTTLTSLFSEAAKSDASATDSVLGSKIDALVKHNEDIAKAILLLLELNREHLPQITRHTGVSAGVHRPPRPLMPQPSRPQFYQTQGYKTGRISEPPPLPPKNDKPALEPSRI